MEAQQEAHASTTKNIPYKKQKNTENKTTNIDERERDVRAFEAQLNKQHKDYVEKLPQQWKHNDYTSPDALDDLYKTYDFVPKYNVSTHLSAEQVRRLNEVMLPLQAVWDDSDAAGLSYPKASQCVMKIPTVEEPNYYIPDRNSNVETLSAWW